MIQRSKWARYALAIGSAALAIGIRASLNPVLRTQYIFGLAFCAVVATSWFGGKRPGILTVLLESVATWYFVLPPVMSFAGKPQGAVFQVGVFAFISSFIAILTGSLRKANDALEDREAQLHFMAAAMPEILFTADVSGRIETLSERFVEFSGKSRGQVGRSGWLDLLHAEDKEATAQAWSASIAKQTEFRTTCRLLGRNGAHRWFQCRAVPMLDKQQRVVRWFGVCADIDDHKLLQNELAQQGKALARSNEDLQRFAFAASHDLQEPLRMIGVFSELLIRNQAANNEASYLVAQITRGVNRMQELIQSTLDFSHIRAEDTKALAEISLEQPLADALWGLQAAVEEAAAKIVTEHPLPEVLGDPQMISRVFQNLVQNAMKFRGTEPAVIQIASRCEGDICTVSVADNGIGMSMEYAESIFEPFRRLHPRGGYPGSGLGLASVKRIVELHQGRVWVQSEEGRGCTFFFTLPLARSAKRTATNADTVTRSS